MNPTAASPPERRVVYTPTGRRGGSAGRGLLSHRELIFQLVRRELGRRYRGRLLGLSWLVLQPLLMLGLYTFVFGVVFGARWPGFESQETLGFAMAVFTGLIPFGVFAEVANASPRLVMQNRTLLKNVDFPAEVLPIVMVLCALVQAGASLAILLVGLVALGVGVPATALLLPVIWIPLALFSLGVCYLLSAAGVFARDLEGVVGLVVAGLLFGSAIFYPLSQVPGPAREMLAWLPTCFFVDATRQLLLGGHLELGMGETVFLCGTVVFAAGSFWAFTRSQGAFTDVL